MYRWIMVVLFVLAFTPLPAMAQEQRCFTETNQCISGPIRSYWERNGGLSVFGFPITPQSQESVENVVLQVQWFERDRIEIQPDGSVTAGRLGVERLAQLGTPWQQGPNSPAPTGCATFSETGHTVCEPFLSYWRTSGGLARFGFPVTPAFTTELEGKPFTVQYFERRRFELHPEIGPNAILLGLLGREVFTGRQGLPPAPAPLPTPVPGATPAPQPPPPSYNNCAEDPNAANAPNYPIKIVTVNKEEETVTLQNVSPDVVSLDGWRMCSIKGNQQHPVGGTLTPNETKTFQGPSGQIWSNSDNDNGVLYNAQGQLISYWFDSDR
jgi:hypothetical protein